MKKLIISFAALAFLLNSAGFAKNKKSKKKTEDVPTEEVEVALTEDKEGEDKVLLPKYTLRQPEGEKIILKESWGYVMAEKEDEYNSEIPLTDVCYFAADINCYGELVNAPVRSNLDTGNARCHMVVACDSKSLTHFVLNPNYGVRQKLLKDIVKAASRFDGVQIDFELVPARDRKYFLTFLADLRYMLGDAKWFTVCVPARFKLLTDDIYPYAEIARYCDRVFVMAYDQHWSTSAPGPVADLDWCQKILDYAQKAIPERKLIMGIPFYGRSWASETTAGAWYFSGANRIMTEHGVTEVNYDNEIPTFKYTAKVDVTGYFNDISSCLALCRVYQAAGIQKIGYWRIGQEDPGFWNWVEIVKK